jgi:hypothetical protein
MISEKEQSLIESITVALSSALLNNDAIKKYADMMNNVTNHLIRNKVG